MHIRNVPRRLGIGVTNRTAIGSRIGKKLEPAECLGEFIGVARFGSDLAPAFADTLTTLVESEGVVNDYFERAVDRLHLAVAAADGRRTRAQVQVGRAPLAHQLEEISERRHGVVPCPRLSPCTAQVGRPPPVRTHGGAPLRYVYRHESDRS